MPKQSSPIVRHVSAIRKAVTEMHRRPSEEEREILLVALTRKLGEMVIGIHECSDSPIGRCVYHPPTDCGRGDDDCIFCHDPHERK